MRIAFLDAGTVGLEDLDLEPLRALGELTLFDFTAPEQVADRLEGFDVALTNKVPIRADVIDRLPALRYIGVTATGFNVVDVPHAAANGIVVTNVPAYSTMSVAQTAFGLLLELTHGVGRHSDWVRSGGWASNPAFTYWDKPLVELDGLTLGIVGYGTIGRVVGKVAQAFGMKVIAEDRGKPADVPSTSRDDLLARSDVLSLHCPQTPQTVGMVNREFLAKMKPTAILLNTARGGLIVESDLADVLNRGALRGAGLDVLSSEPPSPDNPLLTARNCVITPHYAWATLAARRRLMAIVASNLAAYQRGLPVNTVG